MPTSDYRPDVTQVASLVRDRTRDSNGRLVGTFTNDGKTSPTADQVSDYINDAVAEAYPVFGEDILDAPGSDRDALRTAATRVVAFRAAALVEINHFKQEVTRGTSTYQQYQDSFEKGLTRVGKAINEASKGDLPGTSDDNPGPFDTFPVAADGSQGLIGWGTRW
jgi:hypothetical protein